MDSPSVKEKKKKKSKENGVDQAAFYDDWLLLFICYFLVYF